MDKSQLHKISDMLDEKLSLMDDYNSITLKLTMDDFDCFDKLLEARQGIIEKVNSLDTEIKKFVSGESLREQEALKKLFSMNNLNEDYNDMNELRDKLIKLKSILVEIQDKEHTVSKRLIEYKLELSEELLRLGKGKQVINYMDITSKPDLYKGSKFDQNS